MKKIEPATTQVLLANGTALTEWFTSRAQLSVNARESEKKVRHVCVEDKVITMMMGAGYQVVQNGIALVPVIGPMFKGYGSWGYADQSEIKASVKAAALDPNVNGIMLLVDSPGGSVAGTEELADEIKAADKVKPVYAYIEDLGASAAYWTAASARAIYSNAGAWVGSIGVITALEDWTKYLENIGIKVTPIVTGKYKGVGDPTQATTEEHVAYIQKRIDAIYARFAGAVSKGRGISVEKVKALEAAVFMGDEAVEKKLIDGVMSFEKAFIELSKESKASGKSSAGKRAKALTDMDALN